MGDPTLPSEVHFEQLDQAVVWLEQLQGFLESHCLGHMPRIAEQINSSGLDMDGVDHSLTGKATVFGAFYSGYGIQAKHDAAYAAVREGLKNMAQHLGKSADATRQIAANYRTAEERNRANMQDVQRALESGRYTAKDPNAVTGGQTQTEADAQAAADAQRRREPQILAPGPLDGRAPAAGTSGTGTPV